MRGVLDLGRLDAPRQQVVAVDDDVVGAGVDRVDDRQPGRPDVEERLGVALAGLCGERLAIDRFERQALRPDRSERRDRCRSRARVQSCSGASAGDDVDSGAGEWPLTGADASIGAR